MDAPLERLTWALADRYTLEREIGSGGMATVYLAQDLKHDRRVAVKVLDPDLAQSIGAERFLREIKTAANLAHPHILPVFDSGEAEGFLFYTMPYVEAESLRTRLSKERQLPVEDAIQITREIADALAYAHDEGVIHRDVKPANIMLEAGHAVLADFGVAHAIAEARGHRITRTGLSLGTPAYMSPEQATGERDLDGRSDQYALGCVLFEMLSGHPPFRGARAEAVMRQHLTEEPPSVTQARPSVSEEVAKVITRSLAKSPADRFKTMGEMAAALALATSRAPGESRRSLKLGIGLVASALVTVLVLTFAVLKPGDRTIEDPEVSVAGPPPSVDDRRPSVAVLLCANFSPNPEDAFRAQGIHEEILLRLQSISTLRSIARTSVLQFAERPPPVNEIASALGVGFVGECSVLKDPEQTQIRVTFQLFDASGSQVWAERYDRDLTLANIYDIQDDIAQRVANSVGAALLPADEARIASTPTESLEAYDAYQRGRYFYYRLGRENALRAIEYFRTAIDLDPAFATAYVGLSDAHRLLAWYSPSVDPEAIRDSARVNLEKALELDSLNAEALASLASFRLHGEWDLSGAEAALQRALSLNPDLYRVKWTYANLLPYLRGFAPSLPERRQLLAADPFNAGIACEVGLALEFLGRLDEAISQYETALEIDSNNPIVRGNLGWAYLKTGKVGEAIEEFRRLEIGDGEAAGGLTHAYVELGEPDKAQQVYDELLALANQQRVSRVSVALAMRPLDEDRAFDLLVQAVEERDPKLLDAMRWTWWSYRDHPRYREILNSMGFDFDGDRFVDVGAGS
jgi:serine/threonine-protein kinase